jgi:hypothetical protein
MAERKRKHNSPSSETIEKKLKTIEEKQDSLVFGLGKMFQLVLKTHQLLEKPEALPASTTKQWSINAMFSKTNSRTGLTRAHIYVSLLITNIYPTDMELCSQFVEKRDNIEAKEVKKWWNTNRHKIIK